MSKKNLLKQTKLFGELKSYEWDELLKITHEKDFKENDIIFSEGDMSSELYMLLHGEVEIKIKIAQNEYSIEGNLHTLSRY